MTTISSPKYSVIMEKLKDRVLKIANSDPNKPLSPSQISLIEQQLLEAFPVFQTPTHPTYSAMIQDAIKVLNEEHGSNEESISEFIKANYEGLPWAHNSYLNHHLCKLCESGAIVCNPTSKCYSLPERDGAQEGDSRKKHRKRRLVRRSKDGVNKEGDLVGEKVVEDSGDLNGVQEEGIEEIGRNEDVEGGVSGEKVTEVSGDFIGFEEDDSEEFGRSRSTPTRRSLRFHVEDDKFLGTTVDGAEQNLVTEGHNEVIAQEDGYDDTNGVVKLMRVPAECVEESPMTAIIPSVSNIRGDDDSELAGTVSGLKESELMCVPSQGNTSISESAELNLTSGAAARMLVFALPVKTEQKQLVCKNSPRKRLKRRKQEKINFSLEICGNLPKRRLSAGSGCGNLEISQVHDRLQELLSQRGLDTKASGIESQMGPGWLVPMLNGQYFSPCSVHVESTRNSCNRFCLDCIGIAFCFRCLSLHKGHRVVQVRKYALYDVVKVEDIKRHLDISGIQTYIINGADILFINPRPNLKLDTGSPCCENCCRGLFDSFRFCSVHCKLCAALCESTKFEELPVDQSEQSCTSASIEPMEGENNSDPSYISRLADSILVEDEEDLPLQKVLEKCSKRKKQAEQSPTADTPLATEATSLLGSKSQVDLPISEGSKQQIEDQGRQSQIDFGHDVEEAPMITSVEEDVPISDKKSEPKQSEATMDSASDSDKKCEEPKQSQSDVGHDVAKAPLITCVKEDLPISEATMDSTSDKNFEEPKQSEANLDPVNLQSKKLKEGSQGKLRKIMMTTKDDGTKLVKKAGRGRPRKKMVATKEDVASSSNLPVDQQEGLCYPATNQHSQNPGKKRGRGRPRKYIKVDNNDAAVSLNSDVQHRTESSVPATDDVVHGRKLKKDGRGRPSKEKQANKKESAVELEPAHKLEEKELEVVDCVEKSQSEAQEGGQAMPPSDDDIHGRMKTQDLDGGDESGQKQEEQESEGKFAVEGHDIDASHPKDESSTQVPLSSLSHLRSRSR